MAWVQQPRRSVLLNAFPQCGQIRELIMAQYSRAAASLIQLLSR
jgi:hypothetical protein